LLHTACDSMTHQIRGEMSRSAFIGVGWVSPSAPEAPCASLASYERLARKAQGHSRTPFSALERHVARLRGLPHALLALPRVYNTATLIEFQCRLDFLWSQFPATSPRLVLLSSRCLPLPQHTTPDHGCTSCLEGVVLAYSTCVLSAFIHPVSI
jgi:hypothetical protein